VHGPASTRTGYRDIMFRGDDPSCGMVAPTDGPHDLDFDILLYVDISPILSAFHWTCLLMFISASHLESPLGLGVRLESKVGGSPSDEITCWRLTPVVIYFSRSSEGHLLIDRSVAAQSSRLFETGIRDSMTRGQAQCISFCISLSTFEDCI
jgi:hypothetical protein